MNLNALKSFDWRSLRKYANPQTADDLNRFLEKLPQNTGKTGLVIAGIIWAVAGALGLYTTLQLQELTELRAKLQEALALQPAVPQVVDVPVSNEEIMDFAKKSETVYPNLKIETSGSLINIRAEQTGYFGQFREAIGHVQNGGTGWRVNIDRLCVGRECKSNPLEAALKINKVSVSKPG